MPVLLWKDGSLVKGKCFNHSRVVGSLLPSLKVYNARDVDELVLVDVTASLRGAPPRFQEIGVFAKECDVPLTIGGGIKSESDIEAILQAGADKVLLNSVCYSNPNLIASAARRFGSQCVVVGVDYWPIDGRKTCFSEAGSVRQEVLVSDWVHRVEGLGAGEILLTDCSRDGMMSGFDVATINSVATSVTIPVIAAGGAGSLNHFVDVVLEGRADAVAAGSVFQFTEITPIDIKRRLSDAGVAVRLGLSR